MSGDRKAYIYMILAMTFYGISFPATKEALKVLGPITIVTSRLVISSIFLLVLNGVRFGKAGIPRKADLPLFLGIALMQPLGYFLCETFGLRQVSASVASILIATMPVITPVFSRLFLGERITRNNYLGLVISFLGVVMLVLNDFSVGGDMSVLGVLLIFGAVFAAIFYTLLVRGLPTGYSPVTITAVQNLFGLLMFLPLFFTFEYDGAHFARVISGEYGWGAIISIVFLAVFASSLAFIFLNYGIKAVGPSKANGFVNLVPAVTAVVSLLFFGERFTLLKAAGMVVVILGVLLSQHGSVSIRRGKQPG